MSHTGLRDVTWREVTEAKRELREMQMRRDLTQRKKREARQRRAAQIAREHAEAFSRPLIGEEYRPSPKWRRQYADRVRGAQRWYSPE